MLTDYWRIQLFGDLRAAQGEQHIKRFRAQKYGLLLAYLAYYGQSSHPREALAALLWPDALPEAGRLNLRVALTSLRKQLEPPGVPRGSVLVAEGDTLQLHPDAFQTDVQVFEQALREAEQTKELTAQRDCLIAAVEAYQGRLLPGFYEDWVSVEQSRLEERNRQALHRLIATLEQLGDLGKALDYAHRAVGLDPLDETGHQFLIRLFLRAGQPGAAHRQFQDLERQLREQLGAKPSPATRHLLETTGTDQVPVYLPAAASSKQPSVESDRSLTSTIGSKPSPAFCLLPLTLNRFFGREVELSALDDRFADAGNRLVTIVGTGGAGKTRLAIEAARHFYDRGTGSAGFVSLSGTADPETIPETILSALRLTPIPRTDPIEQVIAFLLQAETAETARVLLVLDNIEHLLAADALRTVEIVQTFLTRLPGLTFLMTSRQPLQMAGELRAPLSSLPVPTLPGTPERLREFAGIQLFVERAQAVRPDFQITTRNVAALTELCRRLDGLPLAIELAAAWAQTLTPAQMLNRLSNRFQMLVSRRRDTPPRHRSLHAAITSSYSLLPMTAQSLFRQLSVFRGGFTLEAVQVVSRPAEAEPSDRNSLEDLLALLQEHSLLGVEESEEALRFSLLESLREFALEQNTRTESFSLAQAHADWCRGLTYRAFLAEPKDRPQWQAVLLAEQENCRAALEFCFQPIPPEVNLETLDPERFPERIGSRIAVNLRWYWQARGAFTEGRRWLELALARAETAPPDPWTEQVRFHLAGFTFLLGLYSEAELHALTSLNRWQPDWDPLERASVLSLLGQVYGIQSEFSKAEPVLQESLAIFKAAEDWSGASDALNSLGIIHKNREDFAQARLYLEEGLGYDRARKDQRAVYIKLANLGTIAMAQKEYGAAENFFTQSLEMIRAVGDRPGVAILLSNLSVVTNARNLPLALAYMQESLTIRNEIQDRHGIIIGLNSLGDMMTNREPWRAVRFYASARTIMDRDRIQISPANQQLIDDFLEKARVDPGLEEAWRLGRLLSPEAAVEEALLFCSERGEIPAERAQAVPSRSV